jgi:hypothetical protein
LSLQEVFGWRDPIVLRAATNFEGGVVGCGETCGVVTGGILGIGALSASSRYPDAAAKEKAIYRLSDHYKKWFERRFGTSICRERVQVDLSTAGGLFRYLLPGDKLIKCLHHTGEAVWFLSERIREEMHSTRIQEILGAGKGGGPQEPHCTFTVLKQIDPGQIGSRDTLGWATTGLAGGVALSGSVCGALLGGILGIGLRYGYDVRSMSFWSIVAAFIRGHRNLLKGSQQEIPKEAFARSKCLATRFRQRFGSLRCQNIAKRSFISPDDLRRFLNDSKDCQTVFSWCEHEARELIAG